MARVAQMLTQEPIYKSSSIFCFKPILLSAHKLILLIYADNRSIYPITQNILRADIGNHNLILLQTTEYYKRQLEINPYQTLEQIWRLKDS